jgi:DtxR family Mn-dependent transcriptional regulator
MIHPLLALTTATAVTALVALLVWPRHGLWWRLLRRLRTDDRVLVEDALKHLHDCEYRRQPATVMSLAGALGQPVDRVAALVARLGERRLVEAAGEQYHLTGEGRRYARQVVRVHRLWERYLADETGLDAASWHAEADRVEHGVSAEEADALAARLGNPRFDPHGDPIPTASGELAPRRGRPLTELAAGEVAEVLHVEDEPASVYRSLLAAGVHPGMVLELIEASPQRLRFAAEGREHTLAPVEAAQLAVRALPEAAAVEPVEMLSSLAAGERGRVVGLAAACRGPERRRMLDLGLVPGTVVTVEMPSPMGDPVAYRIRGAVIALRRTQADLIHVQRLDGVQEAA